MKKVKVEIKQTIRGIKYSVYKKFLWIWWYEYGYIPLNSCFFLFDEDIDRLKKLYGDTLLIEDCRTNILTN